MSVKKKNMKSSGKYTKSKGKPVKKVEKDEGMDLDDAFRDEENVEYADSKSKKRKGMSDEEIAENLEEAEDEMVNINGDSESGGYIINFSKPVSKLKKGDK